MIVPRLPVFDAKAFVKPLREKILKPDGSQYLVFGENVFPRFVQGLRGLRDNVNALDIFSHEVKGDVDEHGEKLIVHTERLDRHAERLSALEAQQPPFPIA